MRRMKKALAVALSLTMVCAMFAGCGKKSEDSTDTGSKDTGKKTETTGSKDTGKTEDTPVATKTEDTGKTLTIYCWNDEFQKRFNSYYVPNAGTMLDGIEVNWVMTPSADNAYQNKLDEGLLGQESATEKIDLFLIEADYALKYVNSDYTMNVKDLGITDADIAEQYQYTNSIATDSTGALKALSWQATPGLFIYRRSMAQEVFGTDDPAKVQELLSDWDKFDAAAAKVNEVSGGKYTMLSGYDDAYRTFSNNVTKKWVDENNTIQIDDNIWRWVDQTKAYTDNGYNAKTSLWSPEWGAGLGGAGTVFGYFYSTWGIAFTMRDYSLATSTADGGKYEKGNGSFADWAACYGPQSFYWGGTWICAAKGTDNANLVADIMRKLTCDKEIAKAITNGEDDYTNNKAAIAEIVAGGYQSAFLGGQDHLSLLSDAANKIDMSNTTPYDQGLNESFQGAMKDYFEGTVDKATALENFYTDALTKYPDLKR